MITGPHSFTDATGVEWHIEGYSRSCGAAYVDCRTADGKALTVRPVAYLAPAGLSIPEGAPPPKKRATAAEKRAAAKEAERYATPDALIEAVETGAITAPEFEQQALDMGAEPPHLSQPGEWKLDPLSDPTSGQGPNADAGLTHLRTEPVQDEVTGGTYFRVHPITKLEPITREAVEAMAPPSIPPVMMPAPHPVGCECGNCAHARYGCIICGDKTGACTATTCAKESVYMTRVVHCKQEPFDVYIGRPGPWGNPYTHREGTTAQHVVGSVEEAIDYYRQWLRDRVKSSETGLVASLAALHGKTLGCYCAPGPCHGDVLAEAAAWAITQV